MTQGVGEVFDQWYGSITKTIPLSIEKIEKNWDKLVHDPMRRYAMKPGMLAKDTCPDGRRIIFIMTRVGNIAIYEDNVKLKNSIRMALPEKIRERKLFRYSDYLTNEEIRVLRLINPRSTIYPEWIKRGLEKTNP